MIEIGTFLSSLYNIFLGFGYLGIFLLSFSASLLVFVPSPYLLPVALVALEPGLDPNLVILTSAVGAAIAKTIIFRISYYGQRIIKEETKRRVRPFQKLVSRHGWAAAFAVAATPAPDDLVYIPLGFSRYDTKRFFLAVLAGKIIITGIVVWGASLIGLPAMQFIAGNFADTRVVIVVILGFAGLTAAIIYAIVKVDWEKILSRWFPWTVET